MAISARPVALITGASAGIGAALAREAANDGRDLLLVARRRDPMETLAAELKSTGAEITVLPADLSRPGAAAALMETVEQRGLAIDTLINNAGLGDTGRFDEENPDGQILDSDGFSTRKYRERATVPAKSQGFRELLAEKPWPLSPPHTIDSAAEPSLIVSAAAERTGRNLVHLRIGHLRGGNGWGLLVLLEVLGHCRSRDRAS
jgi:NAD(P)-dependent dehydrogenase (short-subunit alcohol dehydrogenase family)